MESNCTLIVSPFGGLYFLRIATQLLMSFFPALVSAAFQNYLRFYKILQLF